MTQQNVGSGFCESVSPTLLTCTEFIIERTTWRKLLFCLDRKSSAAPRAHAERGGSKDEKTPFLNLSVLCRPGKRSGTPEHMLSKAAVEMKRRHF